MSSVGGMGVRGVVFLQVESVLKLSEVRKWIFNESLLLQGPTLEESGRRGERCGMDMEDQ